MAAYFASDVHLRLDAPERSARFARFVRSLGPDDTLTIVGDLCDFWFASRQLHLGMDGCEGLRALADHSRGGGRLTILAGNHDARLMPEYAKWFDARLIDNDCTEVVHGHRLWLAHGHRLGARPFWKEAMESRAFATAFGNCPGPIAAWFERLNDGANDRGRQSSDRRHLDTYRRRAAERADAIDAAILGHVHRVVEETFLGRKLFVLGNWHRGTSYLRIDEDGLRLIREDADPML